MRLTFDLLAIRFLQTTQAIWRTCSLFDSSAISLTSEAKNFVYKNAVLDLVMIKGASFSKKQAKLQ